MKGKTSFHAEGLCSPAWHSTAYNFSKDLAGIKTTKPGCCKVKFSDSEISRSYRSKVKVTTILLVKKVQFLQLMTYLS